MRGTPEQRRRPRAVLPHHLPRPVRVPVEDRLDQRDVLALRVLQVAHEQGDAVEEVVHRGPDRRVLRGQGRRTAQLGQGQVQQGVQPAVVGERGVVRAGQRVAQASRLFAVQAVGRAQAGRADLEDLPEAQHVLQVDHADPPPQFVLAARVRLRQHEGPAVASAPRLHEPLVLQYLQNLAQRHPTDPEPLGQLPLGRQPLAPRHQPEPHHLEDLFQRLLEPVARPHRPQYRGQPVLKAVLRFQRHRAAPPSQAMVLRNTLWLPADRRSRRRLSRGRPHTPTERRGTATPRQQW